MWSDECVEQLFEKRPYLYYAKMKAYFSPDIAAVVSTRAITSAEAAAIVREEESDRAPADREAYRPSHGLSHVLFYYA